MKTRKPASAVAAFKLGIRAKVDAHQHFEDGQRPIVRSYVFQQFKKWLPVHYDEMDHHIEIESKLDASSSLSSTTADSTTDGKHAIQLLTWLRAFEKAVFQTCRTSPHGIPDQYNHILYTFIRFAANKHIYKFIEKFEPDALTKMDEPVTFMQVHITRYVNEVPDQWSSAKHPNYKHRRVNQPSTVAEWTDEDREATAAMVFESPQFGSPSTSLLPSTASSRQESKSNTANSLDSSLQCRVCTERAILKNIVPTSLKGDEGWSAQYVCKNKHTFYVKG